MNKLTNIKHYKKEYVRALYGRLGKDSGLNPGVMWPRFVSSGRLFTEKHEWISLQDDKQVGKIGISNHAQEALGDVVYVQAPDIGTKFAQFDEVGAIESVKAASELLTPVSGEVVSTNKRLEEKPGLVNSDCYGEGWLFKIKLDDSKELDKLMDEDQYQKYLEESKDS